MQTNAVAVRANPEIIADPRFARLADFTERGIVFALVAMFMTRFVPTIGDNPFNMLLMVSEVLTSLLILFRLPGAPLNSGQAWIVALIGTFAPLLVVPGGLPLVDLNYGIGLMFGGLMLSISAKIFLNRSFGIVAANRGVKRHGPYRLVRHPMYLGYILTHIGFLLFAFSWWNLLVYVVCWCSTVLRIHEEESILARDSTYRDYQREVTSRLAPKIW